MSKELDRELRKIKRAMKQNNVEENPKVLFSKFGLEYIYTEVDNQSFVSSTGELVYKYKFNLTIGARIKGMPYSLVNPKDILDTLKESKEVAEHLIRFNAQIGYYKTGERIFPNELSTLLLYAEVETPPAYKELIEYLNGSETDNKITS